MQTFSDDCWQITLPPEWQAAPGGEAGETAFESDDGVKGIVIGTWRLAGTGMRSPRDIAASFRANHLAGLVAMSDYAWETIVDEIVDLGPLSIALSDAWARERNYRIIGVVLARPPVVVRAIFHDYLCEDLEVSRASFAGIVESLHLVDAGE